MSALVDSQEDIDQSSQDLFEDHGPGEALEANINVQIPANIGREILIQLKKMEKKLDELSGKLANQQKNQRNYFNIETSSFKSKFNNFLKNRFSCFPWLNSQTDVAFKNEVQKNLKQDGFGGNSNAYKALVHWATVRYTELRNQLRRKIALEIKNGRDVQAMAVDEFSTLFLNSFCTSGEDIHSPERIQLCLLLRSFLHKKKMNVEGSDSLEYFSDFWCHFKTYYTEVTESSQADKWEKLSGIDTRRMRKRQETEQENTDN